MLATLAAYLHDLDPFAIFFGQNFPLQGIRWYGLAYLAGFIVAFLIIQRLTKVGISTLKPDKTSDYIMACAIGVFLGGRIGYVLFYQIHLLTDFSGAFPYWGALEINNGGMSSHGGMIGVALATFIYAYRYKHNIAHLWDLAALSVPAGLFFGRMANFVNGELYGRACDINMPLAVKFPQEMRNWSYLEHGKQLGQLKEAISPLTLQAQDQDVTQLIPMIIEKIQEGNVQFQQAVAPLLTARHPSQLYEGVLEGVVLFAVMILFALKPRKPLFLSGIFAIIYGILRFIVEYFRMPDEHIKNAEFATYHITRGQLLSIPLILIGVLFLIYAKKSKAKPLGGLRANIIP